ncbi:GntR family transcriptional regulator [Sphaerisporangium melleum]|uniref:GntR family transcriptional regulator n=1 Tax=Sphaerisporangium melleum TaxID=321316 RepID=A0A917VSJ9_9ACTN|nr:FadR/GntR family transcriptional regulator [Sphaerisporangium melleum]GGL14415.1 GntR family transcriptional regulator [Sphaerisporangium melleum]GII68189.1 GntR family transcriptional regulator [Sphaerisporangium melleum]
MSAYPGRGVHGQVVEAIGRRIVSGQEAPGSTLDLEALELTYDVSKTVVREALKVLAAKGLVDARPKRGTFVRPRAEWSLLDPDLLRWQFEDPAGSRMLDDLYEVRTIVEPAGARLAAARRTDEDVARLEATLASAGAGAAAEEIVEADLAFHRQLLEASRNELLIRMEYIIEIGLRARDLLVHGEGHHTDFLPPHRAVLDAVRASDPEAAERAMRALLEQAAKDEQEFKNRGRQ